MKEYLVIAQYWGDYHNVDDLITELMKRFSLGDSIANTMRAHMFDEVIIAVTPAAIAKYDFRTQAEQVWKFANIPVTKLVHRQAVPIYTTSKRVTVQI
jgi:hypothetical protein